MRNARYLTKFSLTVDMSNAAFEDDPRAELARILHAVAHDIKFGNSGRTFDVNGNTVGEWRIR